MRLLVIDDEKSSHELVALALAAWPHGELRITDAYSPEEALAAAASNGHHAALVDLHYAGEARGYGLLKDLKEADPDLELIVVSAAGEFESVQKAMRAGASDFVLKGFGRGELIHSLERAMQKRRWSKMEKRLRASPGFALVGAAPALEKMKAEVRKLAPKDIPVLLEGETGSGKEVAARALHLWGRDPAGAFVAVNCAAVPATTADSYFFGHERGAFTGADRAREGVFEEADGGTLFLDEINSLSLDLQGRLLRVLQEKEVRRMGGKHTRPVDFRLVAASNMPLKELVAGGKFREDLFYRISAVAVTVPPLRERKGDLGAFASFFIPGRPVTDKLLALFREYDWPGNVRELRNLLQAMDALAEPGEALGLEHLPEQALRGFAAAERADEEATPGDFAQAQAEREKEFLSRTYRSCGGNVSRMARMLGVDRSHLHQKLTQLGVHRPRG
jgi:DNA-binding NtrC family response regulator